jgi:predicted CoA-binding protein
MTEAELRESVLRNSKTIAVLGAHDDPDKAAYYVPEYLQRQGYDIFLVNSTKVGQTILGKPVMARLAEIETPIDMVDVFRRSEALPDHVDDILAMNPLPKAVWFQLGIVNDEVANILSRAGIVVVQNRCALADHQRFGIGKVGETQT